MAASRSSCVRRSRRWPPWREILAGGADPARRAELPSRGGRRAHRRDLGADARRARLPLRARRPLRAAQGDGRDRRADQSQGARGPVARADAGALRGRDRRRAAPGTDLHDRRGPAARRPRRGRRRTRIAKTVLAYEPVWAIGTGRQRDAGPGRRGARLPARARCPSSPRRRSRRRVRILYGGSVKAENAESCWPSPRSTARSSAAPASRRRGSSRSCRKAARVGTAARGVSGCTSP